ncbi:hypothetical protein E8E13_006669 [Curvularia kusanoi]|uniref:Rhodopsin domain-containing protein n=1 Tax=Curvularia kusanoi TaxID=90978 RepID=A0A9P4T997_CURKU|nr:hypothetical protein E8E13_006669 [Curvularia kusanoi]
MILAGMIFTVFSASQMYIAANGGGTHVTSLEGLEKLTKASTIWVVVSEATYLIAMMTVKISLGIFFARIVIAPWHIRVIYVTIGVNICSSVAAFFYCILRCGPNVDEYALSQLKHQCTSKPLDMFMAYQSATFSTLTDIVFVVLPIVVIWNANMNQRSKLSVGFILCLAASACICSMIRFQYVEGLTEVDDFFWNATNIGIWSTIECGASIVAGCLATLRPLLKGVFAKAGSITKSLRSSNAQSNGSAGRSGNPASVNTHPTSNDGKIRSISTDKPMFAEFIAGADEVIEMSSDAGGERESQDRILRQDEQSADFPWPVKVVEAPREPERTAKMHSKHKSWISIHRSRSLERLEQRHSSAESAPAKIDTA